MIQESPSSVPPAPLVLPAAGEYHAWLRERADAQLTAVEHHTKRLRTMEGAAPEHVLDRWNEIHRHLRGVASLASLLTNVHPDAAVRELAEELEQRAQSISTDLGLDQDCYRVLAALEPAGLAPDATRLLEKSLLDFRRSGVDRDEETREKVRALARQETDLALEFSRHVRDGRRTIRVAPERLTGLPADFVADRVPGEDGLVELSTDYPDYLPVRTFAADRSLRHELTVAFLTRAWPENERVLGELLAVRRELAQTLGYPDWPSYDAEVKMISAAGSQARLLDPGISTAGSQARLLDPGISTAGSQDRPVDPGKGGGQAIADFVDRISDLARDAALADHDALLRRARQDHPELERITAVDRYFYTELRRREECQVDAREVRRYFPFDRVRAGLLDVTGTLLGVDYVDVPDAPTWHPDVTVHDVLQDGRRLGRIYLDLHPRPGKYSHAAQFTLAPGVSDLQLPEGVLVCNFAPGLMEHHDVVTLFHEFGHLVHHVLGGHQRWVRFSGVATEWDFVEAPSQMLEEWAWDPAVLARFARDDEGAPLPAALVERMRAAHELGKALDVRTQMFYAALSYWLHAEPPQDISARVVELQEQYDGCAGVPGTHFEASFGHLAGYTSAYYTYMWSQVIAKDLFSAFDAGDLMARDVAMRYRDTILARGGSADAADLVAAFLGRPYSFDAFEAWLRS